MNCPKCKKDIPSGSVFCCWCGKKTSSAPRKPKRSANGTGSAYKRGNGWTAEAVVGWRELPDNLMDPSNTRQRIPIKKTKAGFPTKAAALAYIPTLKNQADESPLTLQQVWDAWEPWYSPRVDKSTMSGYRAAYHYYESISGKRIALITAADLQACMDACPRGKRTHQNMKVVAGLLWKYARDKHIVAQVESENLYTGKGASKKREALRSGCRAQWAPVHHRRQKDGRRQGPHGASPSEDRKHHPLPSVCPRNGSCLPSVPVRQD